METTQNYLYVFNIETIFSSAESSETVPSTASDKCLQIRALKHCAKKEAMPKEV